MTQTFDARARTSNPSSKRLRMIKTSEPGLLRLMESQLGEKEKITFIIIFSEKTLIGGIYVSLKVKCMRGKPMPVLVAIKPYSHLPSLVWRSSSVLLGHNP
jgi:hypothetical protein